jgi:PAS domain S-box-containing protein
MESEIRRVVDALPGLVWTALPNGHIDFLNQRWCDYTGLDLAEACGQGWQSATVPLTRELIHSRFHPEEIQFALEVLERARAGDLVDVDKELRLQMPNGSIKYVHIGAHTTRDQNGRLQRIGAVQDVTERRLSEEALAKVRSELAHVARVTCLGALTASIAHEVNQPLSGIITNASTCAL